MYQIAAIIYCYYYTLQGINGRLFNLLHKDKKYKSATPPKLNSSTCAWLIKNPAHGFIPSVVYHRLIGLTELFFYQCHPFC